MSFITDFIWNRMEDPEARDAKEMRRVNERWEESKKLVERWSEPGKPEQSWRKSSAGRHFQQQRDMAGVYGSKYTVGATSRTNSLQSVLEICEKQAKEGLR